MIRPDALSKLFACNDLESWKNAVISLARDRGFARVFFCLAATRSFPLENALIATNYPRRWQSVYQHEKLYSIDPAVSHCLASVVPITWGEESLSSEEEKAFYEHACAYGLRSGISFPVHGLTGEFGILSLASPRSDADAIRHSLDALAQLSLLRDYILESSLQFFGRPSQILRPAKLTTRELDCLKWIAAGKSSWETSKILGCSEATVNFHVLNLKKKFNAPTRQQAIATAIKTGLVSPPLPAEGA